jgi:spermidine/putrescine transport system ATP-binding protein
MRSGAAGAPGDRRSHRNDDDPGIPVIALEEVSKQFGSVTAVERASFALQPGEFFSLLGPSGCGKTTVLRLIGGFETLTAGRIRIDGADVSALPPHKRHVNTVFQHYALFPHLSVFDNVAYGPRARGLDRDEVRRRVAEMLAITQLGDLAARRPEELSGGQRQRVALARALVNLPRALLLDEPLSALDRGLREAMQGELKRIQREVGIAFVFVTHDQEEALGMSDRLAVMCNGRIEQIGTPEAIYETPSSVFVAGFIGAANLIPAIVDGMCGGDAIVRIHGHEAPAVVPTARPMAAGGRAMIVVRPERLRLDAAPPDRGRTGFPVTVVDVAFHGAIVRTALRTADGLALTAEVSAGARPADLAPGAAFWASWEPRGARVLPAQ